MAIFFIQKEYCLHLQLFYKQYISLPLNISLSQNYSLMHIYLFFSPLPPLYWAHIDLRGNARGRKRDSNHRKSQSAKTLHQTEALNPKTNIGNNETFLLLILYRMDLKTTILRTSPSPIQLICL